MIIKFDAPADIVKSVVQDLGAGSQGGGVETIDMNSGAAVVECVVWIIRGVRVAVVLEETRVSP